MVAGMQYYYISICPLLIPLFIDPVSSSDGNWTSLRRISTCVNHEDTSGNLSACPIQ
jgi:hypothetical protein